MSFGDNIQFLRKSSGITQEALAERLNVSRQTVSKWEQNICLPEMDKLIQICDMFGCSLDSLVRGNLESENRSDSAGYDRHMNRFTASICGGVSAVLFGISVMMALAALGISEEISTCVFLSFTVIAAALFIVGGINHGSFVKKHPTLNQIYSESQIDRFDRKFPILIAAATALILIGVIVIVTASAFPIPAGFTEDRFVSLFTAVFMLLTAIAAPMYVYAGMQKAKYDIGEYNKEYSPDEEAKKQNRLADKWCACIMLTATLLFLLMGFLGNLWHIGWVVFPAGGILCAIVSVIIKKN